MKSKDTFKINEVILGSESTQWHGLDESQWHRAIDHMVERLRPMGSAGTRFLLGFGANSILDLLTRAAAAHLGFVPVTVNWQADTTEVLEYKARKTKSQFIVMHSSCPSVLRDLVERGEMKLDVLKVEQSMLEESEDSLKQSAGSWTGAAMTLFTSGTTGAPKGVELSHEGYDANLRIFESFLGLQQGEPTRVVLVNPLHHANSTSMANWALRYPGAELFVLSHYGTGYWDALAQIVEGFQGRVVAPLVARHFEFLDNLIESGRLKLSDAHRNALSRTEFLVGSAPVGPQTVERFKRLTGGLPRVRFGSTELCLQALGIPKEMSEENILSSLKCGWEHAYEGKPLTGYYIGCPHEPMTRAQVVRSVVSGNSDFMQPVLEGEPGLLVVESESAMLGYVDDPAATRAVREGEWYLGLGDVVFYLTNQDTGARDYYWVSRSAGLMIRGGANYSCVQVETELREFCVTFLKWPVDDFDLAVVGHKLGSEHEDACCVLLELGPSMEKEPEVYAQELMHKAPGKVSKGAKPDHIAFGEVPRNFKGATVRPDVRAYFENCFQDSPNN